MYIEGQFHLFTYFKIIRLDTGLQRQHGKNVIMLPQKLIQFGIANNYTN